MIFVFLTNGDIVLYILFFLFIFISTSYYLCCVIPTGYLSIPSASESFLILVWNSPLSITASFPVIPMRL